jgi:beta-lactamase regulating signal transducer with metallopeptidase domain
MVPFSLESRWSLVPAWKVSVSHEKVGKAVNNGNQPGISEAEDWQGETATKNSSEDHDVGHASGISTEKGLGNPSEANDWQGLGRENVGEGVPHTEGTTADGGASSQNDQWNVATSETMEHGSENTSGNETLAVTKQQADGRSEVTPTKAGKDEGVFSAREGIIATDEGIALTGEGILRKMFRGVLLIIGSGIWLTGILAMLGYMVISYVRLRGRLRTAARLETCAGVSVWMSDAIDEPFVLGTVRPNIYVPATIGEEDLKCVLCHERAHVRRGDYLWKPLGFLILCVYWFHPLCWISYLLFCRDVEMACDEKATKGFDMEGRKRYCQTLLNLSRGKQNFLFGTVAFGENGTKSRVKAVLNYKKPSFWVILAGILACLALGAFFMTNALSSENSEGDMSQTADASAEANMSAETDALAKTDAPAETKEPLGTDGMVATDKTIGVKDNVTLFQAVLLGQRNFVVAEGDDCLFSTDIADIDFLFGAADPSRWVHSFAVVDLDQDGEEEIILFVTSAGNDGSRVILRRWGNMVYAYIVNSRSMWELKTDGTYEYNTGNVNDGFARITGFTVTNFMEDRYTYETGPFDGADTFVVEHASVSENEYKKATMSEHGKKKAVWHEFNEENVLAVAGDFQRRFPCVDPAILKQQVLKEISEQEFRFHEGACNGGYLVIREDGSFSGAYTRREDIYYYLESRFTGSLELTECVDAYTWRVEVTRLQCDRKVGTKWKEEGFTYEEILPPGMEEGGEYLLCLPGKPVEELPRGILYWRGMEIEKAGAWNAYGVGAIPKTAEEAFTDLSQWKNYDLTGYGEDLALYCRSVYPSVMKEWSVKTLSPDRSKYLYGKSENQDGKTVLTIGVIDAYEYHRPTEFRLNTETSNEIVKVCWLSDALVGAETHVNPSTGEFFVYDLVTGQEVKHYIGSSFAVIPGTSHVMYEKNVPHFSNEDVCHSFFIDDQKIYTSDWLNARLGKPTFSKDLTKVSFLEQRYDLDVSREVTCDFDLQTLNLSNIRISIPTQAKDMDASSFSMASWEYDLDRNGIPEIPRLVTFDEGMDQRFELWEDGKMIWSEEGYAVHTGYNALFLCVLNGDAYLLRYRPTMYQGAGTYSYQLFFLENGTEKVVQENSVNFVTNFYKGKPLYGEFNPEIIAAFMDEINDLLSHSTQLLNTDGELLETFAGKTVAPQDTLGWLDMFDRDSSKSLLENLQAFQLVQQGENIAQ